MIIVGLRQVRLHDGVKISICAGGSTVELKVTGTVELKVTGDMKKGHSRDTEQMKLSDTAGAEG